MMDVCLEYFSNAGHRNNECGGTYCDIDCPSEAYGYNYAEYDEGDIDDDADNNGCHHACDDDSTGRVTRR